MNYLQTRVVYVNLLHMQIYSWTRNRMTHTMHKDRINFVVSEIL